jgi:hypothetical protein
MNTSSQLQLFADKCVTWETLPETCQQTVRELLSLLLEQTQQQQTQQQQFAADPENNQEEKHV